MSREGRNGKKKTPNGKSRRLKIREYQAERREKLDITNISVEVPTTVHEKIKNAARSKKMTMKQFVLDTILFEIDGSYSRPWSVFEPRENNVKSKDLSLISLFAGCGGFDLGLHHAGFRTLWANDFDANACETYRNNIGEITVGDIRKIDFPEVGERPDLLVAGFPCQAFSNAGSRKGIKDERGTLYLSAIDAIRFYKPRAVLFENVRGLLSVKGEGELVIESICKELHTAGYEVYFKLVGAHRHHVPQKRLRLFMVGIEKGKKMPEFVFPNPINGEKGLSIGETILDIPPETPNQSEVLQLNPQAIYLGKFVPEGGSWKDIPDEILPERLQRIRDNMRKYRWPNFYRRFSREEVAGTITAAFKPENAGVWHPVEQRVLSVREIARIQSFPDWFVFHGQSVKSKYQQIGNAVPPRLAYELGLQLAKILKGEQITGQPAIIPLNSFVTLGRPLRISDPGVFLK